MRAAIRASMARTDEDLGLALRRALTNVLARQVALQLAQGTAGQTPDLPVAGGGRSVGKARSDVKECKGKP